jgi:hypothetical protein
MNERYWELIEIHFLFNGRRFIFAHLFIPSNKEYYGQNSKEIILERGQKTGRKE